MERNRVAEYVCCKFKNHIILFKLEDGTESDPIQYILEHMILSLHKPSRHKSR